MTVRTSTPAPAQRVLAGGQIDNTGIGGAVAIGRAIVHSDAFVGPTSSTLARTDTGAAWAFGENSFKVASAGIASPAVNATVNTAWVDTGMTDVIVRVTATRVGTAGIILRASGTVDYIMCVADATNYVIYTRTSGGGFTALTSAAHGLSAGATMNMEARISGNSITFNVNGVDRLTATSSLNSTSTKHGMYGDSNSGNYFSWHCTAA